MSETEKWRSMVDVIIPHPTRRQILVREAAGQWLLPRIELAQLWIFPLGAINRELQQRLDLKTTVLRLLVEQWDESQHLIYRTYLLENHSENGVLPTDMHWVGASELRELTFAHSQQQAAIEVYLGEDETTPALRVPWARPGWQRAAETWIREQLEQLGYPLTGPIEQIKHWALSCILRGTNRRGQVYFKVTNASALMVNEATLTQALAQLFPHCMPELIGIDPVREWMLLADFGNEVGWEAPVEMRAEALCVFARLQIESAAKIDELFALGCIDRRLGKLAEQIDPLFSDAEMMAYVDAEKQQQLRAAASRLKTLCVQLDHYAVPATLVHGDMHMSNVARRSDAALENGVELKAGQYLFFDWSDACIAHPFLDMIDILHERDPAKQLVLRDHYLAMWTAYEPIDRLLAMWKIAYPLCALHQAVSYRYILLNTEAACKHGFGWAMPFWFGKILESLDG